MSVRLPYELLLECIDYAAINPLNIALPDYKTLRNLALVSKNFARHTQKALFGCVCLSKNRHALAFGNAVSPGTEKGRWLASLVHTLKARVRNDRGFLTQQLFTAALLACPSLYELDLDVPYGFDMGPFTTVFISRASPIQALRIAGPTHTALGFLRVFPSLKYIHFKQLEHIHIGHVPQTGPACKLVQIYWPGPLHEVLEWVLQNSTDSLEILSLQSPSGLHPTYETEAFERIMELVGPNLRSLHVPNLSDMQARSLRHCEQLEELIYDGPVSGAVIHQLPDTLEHLQVQPGRDALTETAVRSYNIKAELIRYLESSNSLLTTFTWVHDCGLLHKDLRIACERQGIEFRVWLQPHGTYPGERPELGEIPQFPQQLLMSPSRAKEMAAVKNGIVD